MVAEGSDKMAKISRIEPKIPALKKRQKVAAYARVSMETDRLNRLIVNPELVQIPVESAHEPSAPVHKAENEIARILDTLDYDKNTLRKKMLECVSLPSLGLSFISPFTAASRRVNPRISAPM